MAESPDPIAPASAAAQTTKASRDAFLKNTAARFATAVVGIPLLLWALYLSPVLWVFPAICLLAILRAAHELFRMTMTDARPLYLWGIVASALLSVGWLLAFTFVGELAILPLSPQTGVLFALLPTLLVTGVGVFLPMIEPEPNDRAGRRMAWLIAGPHYVGGMLTAVPALYLLGGPSFVVLSMGIAWSSDTGAYFAGRFFGKRKLAPRVSPSKTVEGAIGGMAGSVVWAVIAHFWFLHDLPLLHAIVLAAVANVLGQLGDLAESLIKRSTGVKDSGSILPGHGGLLDRIDALMFTAAACLVYVLAVR